MIEIADTAPDVNVLDAEYHRLLGFPRNYDPGELARDRARDARAWYARHGRPSKKRRLLLRQSRRWRKRSGCFRKNSGGLAETKPANPP